MNDQNSFPTDVSRPSNSVVRLVPRPKLAALGAFFSDCRCYSDRQTDEDSALEMMTTAQGFFELHAAFAVPDNQRDAVIAGFANFTKDSTTAKTFGKQLEELSNLGPATPIAAILARRAKTAAQGQPAHPTSFEGWNIALRFENIALDTTDENGNPLGPDQYYRTYSPTTRLVVDVTLRVPLGDDIATWGTIRDSIETEDAETLAGVKADLIDIIQTEGLGVEAENIVAALELQ